MVPALQAIDLMHSSIILEFISSLFSSGLTVLALAKLYNAGISISEKCFLVGISYFGFNFETKCLKPGLLTVETGMASLA